MRVLISPCPAVLAVAFNKLSAECAGMVSVCAGCDGYLPWAAALVSCLAAVLYLVLSRLLVTLGVDDPVDAVAIHAGGGLWGVIAAPIFMETGNSFWTLFM